MSTGSIMPRKRFGHRSSGTGSVVFSLTLILTLFAVSMSPLLPSGSAVIVAAADEDDDSETTKKKKKKKKRKKKRPQRSSLKIPKDLTKDQEVALKKGIEAYDEALRAKYDRDADPRDTHKAMRHAYKRLERAKNKAPKCAIAHYYFGVLLLYQNKPKKAARILRKAVELNPDFFEAWVYRGNLELHNQNWDVALEHYDRALKIYPDYNYGLEQKGHALIALGKFKSGRKYIRRVQKRHENQRRKLLLLRLEREIDGPRWKRKYVGETKHYRVHSPISQDYSDKMAAQLELVLKLFKAVFKNVKSPDRKFDVWIFKSRSAYVRGGGIPWAAGHYDPSLRKIELWRQESSSGTVKTLNHEGFHQFIADYAPRVPSWLNEGLADYFAPFERKGDMMMSRPNPKRLRPLKRDIAYRRCTPANELMIMTQREMYDLRKIGTHYNQAWGMIYFMLRSGSKFLKNYVSLVRQGADLDEAYEKTFNKINMKKFETKWKFFVMEVNDQGG